MLGSIVNSSVLLISQKPFTSGGRYYYEIFMEKGYLLKIGVSRDNINYEEVYLLFLNLNVTLKNFLKGFLRYVEGLGNL